MTRGRRRGMAAGAAAALLAPLLAVAPAAAAPGAEQPASTPVCTDAVPPAVTVLDRRAVPQVHRAAVDCAFFLSITRGTPTGNGRTEFRPASGVTRAAMASFVSRTLQVAGVRLPEPSQERFTDVEGSVHADAIHRLRAAGVVDGRTDTTYGPQEPVTRGQTASLLLRATAFARGTDASSLERDDDPFTDTDDSVHRRAIAGAHALGLVRGVTADRYSPGAGTTRAQMATVLVRMLESEAQPVRPCTSTQDDHTVHAPADWSMDETCVAFDPEPFTLDGGHDVREVAIVVKDEPVLYEDVLTPGVEAVVTREETLLLESRRAARQERVATAEDGFRPEGERYTLWFVDRGDHTLVAETNDAGDRDGDDYATNQGVLTRMLLSVSLPDPDPHAFSSPDAVDTAPSAAGSLGLVDVRTGTHAGYDRVVLELDGDGDVGWRVAYTDDPRYQGSGNPVDVDGETTLQIHLDGLSYPEQNGVPAYDGPDRTAGPGTAIVEVVVGHLYEGRQGAFAGTTQPLPFRVFRLENPERVVVDVAHPQG